LNLSKLTWVPASECAKRTGSPWIIGMFAAKDLEGRHSFEGVGFNRVLDPGRGSLVLRPADRPIVCRYCYR
jgi:hypothetical protein